VLRGGRQGNVKSRFGRRERPRCLCYSGEVTGRRDFGVREGALILLALPGTFRGGKGVRGLGFGAVRGKVA